MALTKVTSGTITDGTIVSGDFNASVGFGFASVQTFTSSGTWTKPTGVTKVIMEVQGAGGSGSGSPNGEDCNGAGAGGYAKKLLDVSSISTATITVGAGGAGVVGASGTINAGNDGGNSSWADGTNTITANGGNGGTISHYAGTAGGTATGGDVNIQGGAGMDGAVGVMWGGNSVLGFGGQHKYVGRNASAQAPSGYGGGSGAVFNTSGGYTSDAGGAGIVIVWEYK